MSCKFNDRIEKLSRPNENIPSQHANWWTRPDGDYSFIDISGGEGEGDIWRWTETDDVNIRRKTKLNACEPSDESRYRAARWRIP